MGRRGANQTAVFFAALGTAACGLSTNMEMLIVARFVSAPGSIFGPDTHQELFTARRLGWRRDIHYCYVGAIAEMLLP